MSGLAGRFFLHIGPTYMQWGKVVEEVAPQVYLLDVNKEMSNGVPSSMIAVHLDTLLSDTVDETGAFAADWEFFDTEEALGVYRDWLLGAAKLGPKLVDFNERGAAN